ncbi:MAG: hypothetical protein QXE90_03335 [Candidatus Micrarchaeia archaeon]
MGNEIEVYKDKETNKNVDQKTAWKTISKSPQLEKIMTSKTVNTTLAFGKGFAVGFVVPYFLCNSNAEGFELIQLSAAFTFGTINASRVRFGNEEQNKKDEHNFLKWGITAGILTASVFSMPFIVFGSGVTFGLTSVLYHRYKEKKDKTE